MKKLWILLAVMGLMGCNSSFYSSKSNLYADDLYGSHDREAIAREQKAIAEAEKARAEAEKAKWEAHLAQTKAEAATQDYTYQSVLANTYESAYARRLKGFESLSYNLPSSYYELRYSPAYTYVTAYDPMNYNIVVMGDQVWVEPKYISSMFGSWGSPYFSITIGSSGWYGGYYSSWSWPYYSWYGYPRYSWYDWCWGYPYVYFDPFFYPYGPGWGPSYYPYPPYGPGYPPYGPGYYPGHHPSHHPSTPHYVNYRPHGGESGYRGTPSSSGSSHRGVPASPRGAGTNYRTGSSTTRPSGVSGSSVRPSRDGSTPRPSGNYRPSGTSSQEKKRPSRVTPSTERQSNREVQTSYPSRSSSTNYRGSSGSSMGRGSFSGGGSMGRGSGSRGR